MSEELRRAPKLVRLKAIYYSQFRHADGKYQHVSLRTRNLRDAEALHADLSRRYITRLWDPPPRRTGRDWRRKEMADQESRASDPEPAMPPVKDVDLLVRMPTDSTHKIRLPVASSSERGLLFESQFATHLLPEHDEQTKRRLDKLSGAVDAKIEEQKIQKRKLKKIRRRVRIYRFVRRFI